jgi:hypothetical protein
LAEIEIRKFLSTEIHANQQYWDEIEEEDTCPRFYRAARRYITTVYPAFVEEYLLPDAPDPVEAIDLVLQYSKGLAVYLWDEPHGFGIRSNLWNILIYPKIIKQWKFKPEKLSFQDFWGYIWIESAENERPLAERYHDAVDLFWEQRLALSKPESVRLETVIPAGADVRSEVDAFVVRCNGITDLRILKRHVWLAVGHKSARQFEYWQAGDAKASKEDNRNFRRVLAMKPEAFIALLLEKKIIKSRS